MNRPKGRGIKPQEIKHDILKGIIRRSISVRRILRLIDTIISSHEPESQTGRGIPTGALTSRLFANVCLDPPDHFLKEECRVKYCARYMDGFVIIRRDKAFPRERLKQTGAFLRERLDMSLNPKTAVYPGRHGIGFRGYRVWPAHVKPANAPSNGPSGGLEKWRRSTGIIPLCWNTPKQA